MIRANPAIEPQTSERRSVAPLLIPRNRIINEGITDCTHLQLSVCVCVNPCVFIFWHFAALVYSVKNICLCVFVFACVLYVLTTTQASVTESIIDAGVV